MPKTVVTPLSQAMAEGKLTREELKSFMQRSDQKAIRRLALWVIVLIVTGSLIWLSYDSWLIWPAMFLHGIVIVHHFSLQHECVHYTVFRTRWLNDLAGNICGLIIILPHQFFRYEHCDHHTYNSGDRRRPGTGADAAQPGRIPLLHDCNCLLAHQADGTGAPCLRSNNRSRSGVCSEISARSCF